MTKTYSGQIRPKQNFLANMHAVCVRKPTLHIALAEKHRCFCLMFWKCFSAAGTESCDISNRKYAKAITVFFFFFAKFQQFFTNFNGAQKVRKSGTFIQNYER